MYRPPTQTTDDDQTAKTPKMLRGGVWGGGCVPVLQILEFYSWKCYILVHLYITIRSNHYSWSLAHWGDMALGASDPLK